MESTKIKHVGTKITKFHEMARNDLERAWEHHLGVGAVHFGDVGDFDVDSQNPNVGRVEPKKTQNVSEQENTSRNG